MRIGSLLVWGGLLVAVLLAGLTVHDEPTRRFALRAVLGLTAAGEATGAFFQIFRGGRMSHMTGRPYDPAYHGVVQDFGFYNLAVALLFGLGAVDPERNAVVLPVALVLYAIHGATHVLRWLGFYYGGETRIPTRPRELELRDGLPLIVALVAMLVFWLRMPAST